MTPDGGRLSLQEAEIAAEEKEGDGDRWTGCHEKHDQRDLDPKPPVAGRSFDE